MKEKMSLMKCYFFFTKPIIFEILMLDANPLVIKTTRLIIFKLHIIES